MDMLIFSFRRLLGLGDIASDNDLFGNGGGGVRKVGDAKAESISLTGGVQTM
jgi:hypothetical protein